MRNHKTNVKDVFPMPALRRRDDDKDRLDRVLETSTQLDGKHVAIRVQVHPSECLSLIVILAWASRVTRSSRMPIQILQVLRAH
jgi:hypothetical protein